MILLWDQFRCRETNVPSGRERKAESPLLYVRTWIWCILEHDLLPDNFRVVWIGCKYDLRCGVELHLNADVVGVTNQGEKFVSPDRQKRRELDLILVGIGVAWRDKEFVFKSTKMENLLVPEWNCSPYKSILRHVLLSKKLMELTYSGTVEFMCYI